MSTDGAKTDDQIVFDKNDVKVTHTGPPKQHGTPNTGNVPTVPPASGSASTSARLHLVDYTKVFGLIDTMSNKFKCSTKKGLYDMREKLERDIKMVCDTPGISGENMLDYIVGGILEDAAKKGGAPLYVRNEIEQLIKANSHTGVELVRELLRRYGNELPAAHIELLNEFKALVRTKAMSLRDCLNQYTDIIQRMKKEEVDCVPSQEVLGAKLISFIRDHEEERNALTTFGFLSQMRELVDSDNEEAAYTQAGNVSDLTRDPAKLLKLLHLVANDNGRLLSTFSRPSNAPEMQLAAGAMVMGNQANRVTRRKAQGKQGGTHKGKGSKAKLNFRHDGDPSTAPSGSSSACENCGLHHAEGRQNCKAKDDECNHCGRRGHWERCCKQKAKNGKQQRGPGGKDNKKTGSLNGPAPLAAAARASATTLSAQSVRTLRDLCKEIGNVTIGEEVSSWTCIDEAAYRAANSKVDGLILCVDTACTATALPYDQFAKFIISTTPCDTKIRTASKNAQLTTTEKHLLAFNVVDTHGEVTPVYEIAYLSHDIDVPLLSANEKKLHVDPDTKLIDAVGLTGEDGVVWVKVKKYDSTYGIVIGDPVTKQVKERAYATFLKTNNLDSLDMLLFVHNRYMHVSGPALKQQLNQLKIDTSVFNSSDFTDVTAKCSTCAMTTLARKAVPARNGTFFDKYKTGEACFQDLTFLPKYMGGRPFTCFSVIIDVKTRLLSTLPLKQKNEAIDHMLNWIRQRLAEGVKVLVVFSDNGGEFIGKEYLSLLREHHILRLPGPPRTPQSQGLVERANRRIKTALFRVCVDTGLPERFWPALLPGVTNTLNLTVHTTTNSPAIMVYKMPAICVGDYIAANVDGKVMHGFFVGYTQQNRANVIVRERHQLAFSIKVVHPVHIKLLH